jgi:hypothetical protein
MFAEVAAIVRGCTPHVVILLLFSCICIGLQQQPLPSGVDAGHAVGRVIVLCSGMQY